MKPLRPSLYPVSLSDLVSFIGDMSDKAFEVLAAALEKPEAFDATPDRCKLLAAEMDLPSDDVGAVINVCGYLYGRVHTRGHINDSLDATIATIITNDLDIADKGVASILQSRLCRLLAKRAVADSFRKQQRLKTGFFQSATQFSFLVDLRPDFGQHLEIVGLIPMIQFRIVTDSERSAEKEIAFQIDEATLQRLKRTVDRADQTLQALKKDSAISQRLVGGQK